MGRHKGTLLVRIGGCCTGQMLLFLPVLAEAHYTNLLPQVFPLSRSSHPIGPGIEVRDDPMERRRRGGGDLDDMTSME